MSKKNDFKNSVKEMSEVDLTSKIQEDELRLKKLKFAHSVSPLENPMNIRDVRRDLARLKTQLRAKKQAA
ncbi:MAG TPA: 50S ribosomal protein L29, partial [Chitinophagaceae bacterium]|nr:50S ribosomal protein L29 [Chitinophagaceae bacterium]